MSLTTYLSDYVYRVIVDFNKKSCKSLTGIFITKELTYNWSRIKNLLGEITDGFDILCQSEEWYLEKAQLVWDVIHEAGSAVVMASDDQRTRLYQLCEWVEWQPDVVEYALNCGNVGEDGPLLAALVLTAALERALGNVYMTRNRPVPFLLRDLLKTPELTLVLGKVPVVFTQLLVGCPRGLNLRNVAWHGFLSAGELHPHLVSALAVLVASLGAILQDYQVIPKRPQFSSFEIYQEQLDDLFPDILSRQAEVQDMIETSPFIPQIYRVLWNKAYNLLQTERYGYSLVLILPLLEHCLRVLYCKVNNCPDRLLTAESTVFYTTLDEILAPAQSSGLSSGLLMLLLDLTSSLSGPRVRDRLSHGEVHLRSVPRWLANLVLCASLAASHSDQGDCKVDTKHCDIPLCAQLQETTSHYHSRFHVLASLRRQLTSLLAQWPGWQHFSPPADASVQPVSCQLICELDQMMFPGAADITGKLAKIKECMGDSELPTLYRPKAELELAAALSAVVTRVTETASKAGHATESRGRLWRERGLRSRARATAVRMWSVLPDVWTALLCAVMVATLCCRQLPQLATRGKGATRFIKSMTKAVENTVTMCDVDNNRWMEAHQALSNMAASCLQFLNDNPDLINKM